MATNFGPYSIDDNQTERGSSLIRTAMGLSPLALGAYAAFQGVSAVGGIGSPFKSGSPIRGMGEGIGAAARKGKKAYQARGVAVAEALTKALREEAIFDNIERSVEGFTTLLHTMSVAVEDPTFGVNTGQMEALKAQITAQMNNMQDLDSAKNLAEKVVGTILDSSDPGQMSKLNQYISEFSAIAPGQIEAPNFSVSKSGVSYNPIDIAGLKKQGLDGAAEDAERLKRALKGTNYSVKIQQYTEFDGTNVVAQIHTSKGKWKGNIPLAMSGGNDRYGMTRSGEAFNTLYAAPRRSAHAPDVAAAERKIGRKDFRAGAGVMPTRSFGRFAVDELISELEGPGNGFVNFSLYNERITTPMMLVNRPGAGFPGAAHVGAAEHIRKQVGYKMNVTHMGGLGLLPSRDRVPSMARWSTRTGYDAGIGGGRIVSGFGDNMTGMLGHVAGSPFEAMRNIYGFERTDMPITMREHQMIGRETRFIDEARKVGKLVNGVRVGGQVGGVARGAGSVIPDMITGGLNKAMVINFNPKSVAYQAMSGEGMGFTGVKHRSEKPMTFSVLDPVEHGYGSSKTLRRLAEAEGTNKAVWVTQAELREGQYLGQSGSKAKMLPNDPNAKGMWLSIDRTLPASGKSMISISAWSDRLMSSNKLFGFTFKGNMEQRPEAAILAMSDAHTKAELKTLGIGALDAGYISPDYIKKGRSAMAYTMQRATELYGGGGVKRMRAMSKRHQAAGKALGQGVVGEYAVGALMSLKGNASGTQIGMALAGAYHGVEGKHGLDKDALSDFVRQNLSKNDAVAAITAMKKGVTIITDTYGMGESAGDRGIGRAGVESRFAKNLWERLRLMGMEPEEASGMISDIYNNKLNFSEHFGIADNLMKMSQSVSGGRGMLDLAREKGVKKVSYADLLNRLKEPQADLINILKSDEFSKGMLLDIADAPTEFKHGAQKTLKQGQVFLPGREMFAMSQGTDIRQAGGAAVDIAGAYGKVVNSFQERFIGASQDPTRAEAAFSGWSKQGNELLGAVFSKLASGKIKGSSTPTASNYDLTTGFGMTKGAKDMGQALYKKTSGTAAFLNADGFVSQLRDSNISAKEKAQKLDYFFTGMEASVEGEHFGTTAARAKGLYGVTGRHPQVSVGNTFITETFRSLEEITGLEGRDEFFQQVVDAGMDQMPDGSGRKTPVTSFGDVAKLDKNDRRRFFSQMAANLDDFANGSGGGVVKISRMRVMQGGVEVDMGQGPQAILDKDGDTVSHVLLGSKHAKRMKEAIATGRKVDMEYRTYAARVSGLMSDGMKAFHATLPGVVDGGAEYENAMKEIALNQSTGKLDVGLRPLQDAVLAFGPDGREGAEARGMLGALTEQVLLKAKKHERYMPLAEELTGAADSLMKGDGSSMRRFLKEKIFLDTGYDTGDMTAPGPITVKGGKRVQGVVSKLTAGMSHSGSTLDGVVDVLESAAGMAQKYGGADMTAGQLERGLNGLNGMEVLGNLVGGDSMLGSSMRGYRADRIQDAAGSASLSMGRIKDTMARMDLKGAAPIAAGLLGSALAFGVMGDQGYAPTPIVAAGEMPSGRLNQAVSQGSLFSNSQVGPSGDQMSHRQSNYDMMNTPINTPTTYMNAPNGYQVRGEVHSESGLGQMTSYLNRMGSGNFGGSILINDHRKPITSSYVDRLMGEY